MNCRMIGLRPRDVSHSFPFILHHRSLLFGGAPVGTLPPDPSTSVAVGPLLAAARALRAVAGWLLGLPWAAAAAVRGDSMAPSEAFLALLVRENRAEIARVGPLETGGEALFDKQGRLRVGALYPLPPIFFSFFFLNPTT